MVLIRTYLSQLRNTSLEFEYEIFNKKTNQLLAKAGTQHVFINSQRRPVKIPEKINSLLEKVVLSNK